MARFSAASGAPFNFLLLALCALPQSVFGGVHEVWWNITYVEDVNPDGLFPRRVIGANGTWPPPPIEVSTNDTLILHALNSLDIPSSLHHHGMFFNATSWYDGAVGVSQCGIPPGETFTYVVPVNSSDQWGTYWVHAHASGQYVDGLRAPLILHPPTEAYTYDEDFTVVLGDWYHTEHDPLLKQFISIANPGGAEPVPDSGLIYFTQNGTYLPGFNENATLPFEPGKTYRLRILNSAAFSSFFFWIDGHDMRIIEVDGTDTQEYEIDLINIAVAQRYSVLVTARNDTNNNWVIHANMDTDMFDTVPDSLNPNITSSITYSSSASLSPAGTVDAYHDVNDTALVPFFPSAQLPPATHTIPLLVAFDTMTDGTNRAMFNSITYNTPVVPAILSALTLDTVTGTNNASAVASAYGPWAFVLEYGESVDLLLNNSDSGKHPFHLHGHKFQIIQRSTDYTSDDPSLNPPVEEGQTNPVRRDTIQVPGGTGAVLRFTADNPGAWFFHCHIEWHLEAGLAVTFISGPAQLLESAQSVFQPPSFLSSQCADLNMPTTGNAAGKNSTTDLTGLTIGPFLQNNGWHAKGIGAMFGCVLTAVIGMATVAWYSLGQQITDEEVEEEVRRKQAAKAARGGLFGRFKAKQS